MGTPDNPDIWIQWYDSGVPGWKNLFPKTHQWITRDGGLRKSPLAEVVLVNPSELPSYYDLFRINADIRGVQDQVFYGRVFDVEKGFVPGRKKIGVLITALGLEGAKLNRDTITRKYQDEQDARKPETKWTFKDMIIDFLDVPDSGYSVWDVPGGQTKAYRLDTDSGPITNAIYGGMNFGQQSLLDAFRRIAEFLAYDGYVYIDPSTDKARVKFVQVGTLGASPSVTLQEPFLGFVWKGTIRPVKNYILVKGGADIGLPHDKDKWTERGYSKYTPKIWSPYDSGDTVSDDNTANRVKINEYSLKLHSPDYTAHMGCILNLPNAGHSSLDLKNRYTFTNFYVYPILSTTIIGRFISSLRLKDTSNKYIHQVLGTIKNNRWHHTNFISPLETEIFDKYRGPGSWYGDIDFNPSAVNEATLLFYAGSAMVPNSFQKGSKCAGDVWIDEFYFEGGREIIPTVDGLNPPVKDQTSIDSYGVSLHWLIDQDINSFDMAQYEGQRFRDTLKDPMETVELSKKGYTWVRPTQTVTLNVPRIGISSETWRPLEVTRRWSKRFPKIITDFELVKQSVRTPPPYMPTRGEVPVEPLLPPIDWRIIF